MAKSEAERRAQAKYRANNKEKISKYNKEYYQKNIEELKAKRKQKRLENKEKERERNRLNYLKRKEKKENERRNDS